MRFPLDFWNLSLLLAAIAIILLVSSLMLSSYQGKVNILINKKKLKNAAIGATVTFIITAAMIIASQIIT